MKPYTSHIFTAAALAATLALASCYEDKGNYEYAELDDMTITLPDNISALMGVDYIEFTPTVESRLEGKISPDNPNYEYGAMINYSHKDAEGVQQLWYDINPEGTQAVKSFASMPAKTYKMWYWVRNKTTGVRFSALGSVNIGSTTSTGWVVLSANGADRHARVDNIFTDGQGNERVARDLLGPDAPVIKNPAALYFYPSIYADNTFGTKQAQWILGSGGAYRMHNTTMQTLPNYNMQNMEFICPVEGEPVAMANISVGGYSPGGKGLITDTGDFYLNNSNVAGSCFEDPLNTDVIGNDPTFKMAPFIAGGASRPSNSYLALLYNATDQKFMYVYVYTKALKSIPDPEDALFSYTTGMDMVWMEATKFSGNVVYNVLQDAAGHRHIYAINISGWGTPTQEAKYSGIDAPHFDEAVQYAFHSQYPFMYYSYGNTVYCYNLSTRTLMEQITMPDRVTRIKFNLFQFDPSGVASLKALEQDQYKLIVATNDGSADGGKVAFYTISETGKTQLEKSFEGFGEEIIDVQYREAY